MSATFPNPSQLSAKELYDSRRFSFGLYDDWEERRSYVVELLEGVNTFFSPGLVARTGVQYPNPGLNVGPFVVFRGMPHPLLYDGTNIFSSVPTVNPPIDNMAYLRLVRLDASLYKGNPRIVRVDMLFRPVVGPECPKWTIRRGIEIEKVAHDIQLRPIGVGADGKSIAVEQRKVIRTDTAELRYVTERDKDLFLARAEAIDGTLNLNPFRGKFPKFWYFAGLEVVQVDDAHYDLLWRFEGKGKIYTNPDPGGPPLFLGGWTTRLIGSDQSGNAIVREINIYETRNFDILFLNLPGECSGTGK